LIVSSLLLLRHSPSGVEIRKDFLRRIFDANQTWSQSKKRKARLWNILHSVEQTSHWRIINLSRMIIGRGRDTMKSPDYVAIGVLVVLLVWAVADQFPRGKL
jgi:hypothetical protein